MKKVLLGLLFTVLCFGFSVTELQAQPSAVGTWTLHYDWGCDGSYSTSTITFYSDGTFSSAGTWEQVGCCVVWEYSNGCTYCGMICGGSMQGMMVLETSSISGCWYAVKTSTATSLSDKEASDGLGPDGE